MFEVHFRRLEIIKEDYQLTPIKYMWATEKAIVLIILPCRAIPDACPVVLVDITTQALK